MGQLSSYVLPTEEVRLPGGQTITVRGLAFEDFWIIAQTNGPQAASLFQKMVKKENFDLEEARKVFQGILPQMPELVGVAIALAADDFPAGEHNARRLPPRVHLDALEKIFKLTIESEAEVKLLGEQLVGLLMKLTGFAKNLKAPLSEAGFGESESA